MQLYLKRKQMPIIIASTTTPPATEQPTMTPMTAEGQKKQSHEIL
jgi:hypothetical protein